MDILLHGVGISGKGSTFPNRKSLPLLRMSSGNNRNLFPGDSPPLITGRKLGFSNNNSNNGNGPRRKVLSKRRRGRLLFGDEGSSDSSHSSHSSQSSSLFEDPYGASPVTRPTYTQLDFFSGVKPDMDDEDKLVHMDVPEGFPEVPSWCLQTEEDGPVRFAEPADGLYAHAEEWLSRIPRITDPREPGLYTWIMYTTAGDPTIKFVCKRVYSLYEIGSRHSAIARDPELGPINRIYGAGELRVNEDESVDFNCASGAYMRPLLVGGRGSLKTHRPSIINKLRTFFPGRQTYDNDDTKSFLTGYPFAPLPHDILQMYEDIGIIMTACAPAAEIAVAAATTRRKRKTNQRNRKCRKTRKFH